MATLWQSHHTRSLTASVDVAGRARAEPLPHRTRARIHAVGRIHDGHCRDPGLGAENAALRLRQTRPVLQFSDRLRGTLIANELLAREDLLSPPFADGLFAYNAVVVDDHFQGSPRLSAAQT